MKEKPNTDERMTVVTARYPDQFESLVNALLSEGNWRVAQTEMSVTDHHYYALLIKSAPERPCTCEDGSGTSCQACLEKGYT